MSNNHTAAKVMLVGFSERQQALFAQLFKQSDYQEFTLVDTAPVDVAIVDLDASHSERRWKEFRKSFQHTPAITVSLTPRSHKGPYWLSKPINPHALKSLLVSLNPNGTTERSSLKTPTKASQTAFSHTADTLRDGINLSRLGRCPHSDLSFHKANTADTYQVEDYLEGRLKRAIANTNNSNTPLRLQGHLHGEPLPGELFILPECQSIVTNIKPHLLRALSLINLNKEKAKLEFSPCAIHAPPLETKTHWHAFLWQLSLWTSRGRLQQTIAPKQTFILTQWPNFTVLSEFPYALKLAACLTRNSYTPATIAEQHNTPLPYVYSFFSAANSLGLLQQHTKTARPAPQTAVRGLLQRMLKRLTTDQQ